MSSSICASKMEMEADGLVLTDTTVDKYKGFQVAVIKGDRISRLKVKRLFGKHGVDDNQCHRAGLQVGEGESSPFKVVGCADARLR